MSGLSLAGYSVYSMTFVSIDTNSQYQTIIRWFDPGERNVHHTD